MKKNALRVIALVLVAGMLFAFASCTQEIHVRFVDKEGNDIDISGLVSAPVVQAPATQAPATQTPATQAPATQAPVTQAPATQAPATQAPATEAPATEAPATQAPATEAPATQAPATEAPATEAPATDAPATNGMPSTTEEITAFYKKAVDEVKAGAAGYTKKEWQNVDAVNIGGSAVNSAVTSVLGSFMTVEADAQEQINEKGSDDANRRIAAWTLTDLSQVASATCVQDGSNYKITIIMKDEDTPKKEGSVLGQVTGALLYWEDIETTLTTDPTVTKILTEFSDIHVLYKGYKIEAVMTPDGKFVSIDHTADVDILIGHAKILVFNVDNKSGHMWNYCKFYNFVY